MKPEKRSSTASSSKATSTLDNDALDLGDELDSDFDDDDKVDEKPRGGGKAAKTSKGKGKGKGKAKLEAFSSMPLDVFASIADNLHPLDLLSLASTSKNLRAIVTSDSFTGIWASARRALGLPDLLAPAEDTLNELQYAFLVHVRKCQGVGCTANCMVPDWTLRRRLCKSCRKDRFTSYKYPSWHPDTLDCIASTHYSASSLTRPKASSYIIKEDGNAISAHLFKLQAQDDASAAAAAKGKKKGQSTAPDTPSLVRQFVDARKASIVKIKQDATALAAAVYRMEDRNRDAAADAKMDVQAVKRKRLLNIRKRITDEGLPGQGMYSEAFANAAFAKKKVAEVTDEEWVKIKPAVLVALNAAKTKADETTELYRAQARQQRVFVPYTKLRASVQTSTTPAPAFPLFGDFVLLDSVRPFWDETKNAFDQAQWTAALPVIQADVTAHMAAVRVHAVKTIVSVTTETDYDDLGDDDSAFGPAFFDDDFLKRATSTLFCAIEGCQRKGHFDFDYMSYTPPRALCFGDLNMLLSHQSTVHVHHRPTELSYGHFALPRAVAIAIKTMIDLHKLDPLTARLTDLNRGVYYWKNDAKSRANKSHWANGLIEDIAEAALKPKAKRRDDPVITTK